MAEKVVSIGVHIWVPGKVGFPHGRPDVENDSSYVISRTGRISRGPVNQLLLVVDNFLADTKEQLNLGPEWGDRIIKTHIDSPRPKDMEPSQLRELILERFPADEYVFWGTELYVKKGKPYNGCVKRAKDSLKLPNSRFDFASCLIAEAPKGNPWRKLVEGALSSGWSMP